MIVYVVAVSICNYNTLKLSTIANGQNLKTLIDGSTSKANNTNNQRGVLRFNLLDNLASGEHTAPEYRCNCCLLSNSR